MRGLVVSSFVLAATFVARADAGDLEATPVAARSITLGMLAHGGHLSGLHEGGFGPNLEVALGGERWQYFGELGGSWVTVGGSGVDTSGYQVRAGVGARWLARSMNFDGSVAIDMHLEGFTGLEEYWWSGGGRLTRPDLGFGVGWQVRFLGANQRAVRVTTRVSFAPHDPALPKLMCAGTCPTTVDAGSNSGVMVLMGFQW